VQLSHTGPRLSSAFDEPNLVSYAGPVPVVALAERAGLRTLADRQLSIPGSPGHAAGVKVMALVAGMVAGADSIEDVDVLRHGGMDRLFTGVRAPSTLGTFMRGKRQRRLGGGRRDRVVPVRQGAHDGRDLCAFR
jgi:hypothetical protein